MIENILCFGVSPHFREKAVEAIEQVFGKAYYLSEVDRFEKFVGTFESVKNSCPILIVENHADINPAMMEYYPAIIRAKCSYINPPTDTPVPVLSTSLAAIIEKNQDFSTGFNAIIKNMTLLNLIYIYVMIGEERQLCVTDTESRKVGFLKIGQNKINAAKTSDANGLIALIDMLQWPSGTVADDDRDVGYEPIDSVHIDGPQALMHAVHAIDEGNAGHLPIPAAGSYS